MNFSLQFGGPTKLIIRWADFGVVFLVIYTTDLQVLRGYGKLIYWATVWKQELGQNLKKWVQKYYLKFDFYHERTNFRLQYFSSDSTKYWVVKVLWVYYNNGNLLIWTFQTQTNSMEFAGDYYLQKVH